MGEPSGLLLVVRRFEVNCVLWKQSAGSKELDGSKENACSSTKLDLVGAGCHIGLPFSIDAFS